MANWVLKNTKKKDILEGGRTYLNSLKLALYKTNITLSGTVMPAHTTDEPTDSGYAAVTNPFPNAAVTTGTQGEAIGVSETWVFTHSAGDFTVYGAFLYDPNDSNITVAAVADPSPFLFTAAGQVYIVDCNMFLDTL